MLRRIWTISTVLSFSRIALLAPLAYFLFADVPSNRVWAAGVMLVAAATDFLDGYLARRLHQVTDFGKIIDPLADKIAVGGAITMLVMIGAVQFWYVALVIVRDVLILLGGLYIKSKKNIITQSNWPGKIAVFFVTLVMVLSVLNQSFLEGLTHVVIWASVVLMGASFVIYVQRLFVGSLRAKKGHS